MQEDKIKLTNWEIVSVNPNDKNWNWKDLFCFWGNSFQSLIGFSLITSLYLVYELNFFVVLLGCLVGSFLVYFFANLIGKPSQKHGIPFPVFLRLSMGLNGARYIAMMRGLVGIFMFGVQTYFLSKSFSYLIRIALFSLDENFQDNNIFLIFILGLNIIDWAAFIFSLLIQFFLFSTNQYFKKILINFSAIFVYLGMFFFLIIIVFENSNEVSESFKDLLVFKNILTKQTFLEIITIAGTIFAYFSIVVVNFGDFSRYVKNDNELNKGNLSLILNLLIFSFFSVLIVIGADIILTKNFSDLPQIFTNPTDIIGKFDNISLTVLVLIFILFASGSTNLIANYVPSQNALINFFPHKLNVKSSGLIILILGSLIGIFWLPLLSEIGVLSIVDTVGALFGPIFGIAVTDYYLVKDKKIVNKDIFSSLKNSSYYYSKGWHLKAIYSLFIGFIFAAATIWNIELRFMHSYSWLFGASMSSLTYYLLSSK